MAKMYFIKSEHNKRRRIKRLWQIITGLLALAMIGQNIWLFYLGHACG